MANKGAWTNTPTGSGKVTIPSGYHNGSGYVDTSAVYTNGYNAGVADSAIHTDNIELYNKINKNLDVGSSTSISIDTDATSFYIIIQCSVYRASRNTAGSISISGHTKKNTLLENTPSATGKTELKGIYYIEKKAASALTVSFTNNSTNTDDGSADFFAHVAILK